MSLHPIRTARSRSTPVPREPLRGLRSRWAAALDRHELLRLYAAYLAGEAAPEDDAPPPDPRPASPRPGRSVRPSGWFTSWRRDLDRSRRECRHDGTPPLCGV